MKRGHMVLLGLVASMSFGMNAAAHDALPGSLPSLPQSAVNAATQDQSGAVTNIPLLVVVTNKGQVRDIQHSQRLPPSVNNLLWSTVQEWIKSPARVDGRRAGAQVFMDVAVHTEPRADGNSDVYFTLASIGPVMRGYWKMRGDRINGPCEMVTGNMTAGFGGRTDRCTFKLAAGVPPQASGAFPAQ
ncbi:hypothetical protein [Rhodanobacter sp. DHG33]|uniref:hypothetical protein n=1 Tax=Rhodanobacter sp. DHG33 TaxID=2775921 RepID=UPI001785219D|nr:hypothetical protein [Rhodanobacter sp. DHG33]MBD8900346.1 hypothetical protein [Rhodanobacter sp. DHG33]